MTYYVLANQFDGQLVQVSTELIEAGSGQLILCREGNIPDMSKFYWHGGSLAFIEKNTSRWMSKIKFLSRFTLSEKVLIYELAKTDTTVEVWLDSFRLAEEICLNDPNLREALPLFEFAGILLQGRAAEILS